MEALDPLIGTSRTCSSQTITAGLIFAATAMTGCTMGKVGPQVAYPAASVEYQLPVTTAKVSADLVLQSCDANKPVATPKITVLPVSNPNSNSTQRYQLFGADLSSFTKNRQLAVELYPNSALKSVNGGVADRTGAIITNVLKTGAGIVGLVGGPSPPPPPPITGECNTATKEALAQVKALQGQIKLLRTKLPSATPPEAEELRLAVDALAAEVARLRTGQLHLTLEREISFRKGHSARSQQFEALQASLQPDSLAAAMRNSQGGVIRWKSNELAKWLEVPQGEHAVEFFAVGYCVGLSPQHSQVPAPTCLADTAEGHGITETTLADLKVPDFIEVPQCYSQTPRPCSKTLVMREPANATMVIVSLSDHLKDAPPDHRLASQELQISQWGSINELPLSTGLGGNFTFAAGFNEFGRKTSFTWKSDARGEALTSAAAGIVDAAGTFRKAFTTDLEEQQAEILELETQKKLNALRFCREVIEAGGFTCPAS